MNERRVFVGIVILLGASLASVQAQPLAHYTFDDGTTTDISGNGYDGILLGSAAVVDDPERGMVLQINQSGMQVDGPFEITTSFTLSAWVKLDVPRTGRYYFGGPWWFRTDNQGSTEHYWIEVRYPQGNFLNKVDTRVEGNAQGQLDGQWHHLVLMLPEDGAFKAYFDGVEAPFRDANPVREHDFGGAVGPLFFGTENADGGNAIAGHMDDIRVYNYAVTPEELAAYQPSPRLQAWSPEPADGANDVTLGLLRWKPGVTAVLHNVYFGTDPNLGPDSLVLERNQSALYFHGPVTPGTTYYWRVDEIEADLTTVHEGEVWSFLARPLTAYMPDPADGASDAPSDPNMVLSWLPGLDAFTHQVYFSDNFEDVNTAAAEADRGATQGTTFSPGVVLDTLATYYWRVDETDAFGTVQAGPVWAFATYLPVEDFESYDDNMEAGTTVYDAWVDGWTTETNGSIVGYLDAANGTFGETAIVYPGSSQSMPMDYNNADTYAFSEAVHEFAATQDWTTDGVDTLIVHVRGRSSNAADPLYVGLVDTAGRTGFVTYSDAEVARSVRWIEWEIPLSEFADAGVNLSRIDSMIIGLGDRETSTVGGTGRIFIDEIWLTRPVAAAAQ